MNGRRHNKGAKSEQKNFKIYNIHKSHYGLAEIFEQDSICIGIGVTVIFHAQ